MNVCMNGKHSPIRSDSETLFDQLVHRSGLVSRELFLSNSERELTNYLHIFEILLEQRLKEGLSLSEIISRLESSSRRPRFPPGSTATFKESKANAARCRS